MHFPTSLTYLVPFLSITSTLASPTPALSDAVVAEGPFPIDYSISTSEHPINKDDDSMHILANCYGGGAINTGDIEATYKWFQSQSGNFYLPAGHVSSWTLGSVRLCVFNNYVFENTHVSYWESGWGARSVREQCCFTPYCGGGLQQGHGDSGLAVNIVVKSGGQSC